MTHTAHPYGLRLGFTRGWKSRWFARGAYQQQLKEDVNLRSWLVEKLRRHFVENIIIERSPAKMNIIIKTSRPGFVIGRGGEGVESLKKEIKSFMVKHFKKQPDFSVSIEEVRFPEMHARLVALSVAESLEKRLRFRRVLKQAISKTAVSKGVLGVRIALAGKLDGSEMSRREWLQEGSVPLQTLTADIDFASERAHLPYGDIGIKVWVHREREEGNI